MSLEFITDLKRWQEIFLLLPDFFAMVYYSAPYYKIFQSNGDGTAAALLYRENKSMVFYPFLLKQIPPKIGGKGFYDLETAYGYGGPIAFNCSSETINNYLEAFDCWARQNNVVAEFVRFNPLTLNHLDFSAYYRPALNRITCSITLHSDFDTTLNCCKPARRRNYHRARLAGLQFKILSDCHKFKTLYRQTMQRLHAPDYYYFSEASFAAIDEMSESERIYAAAETTEGELAAAAIFLLDHQSAHYHLGCSNPEFKHTQANAFLMLEFAGYAIEQKKQILHLGGGLSLADKDPLFVFKSGFSDNRHEFFIGRKIHRPELYRQFSERWHSLTGSEANILLHYHYGVENEDI